MQTTAPRRDTRIRECLSKIIKTNSINDISKIDFSMKMFDGLSIGEIKEAIEAEKVKLNCPYTVIANKFLKDGNYFDPFTSPENDGWKPLTEMLYDSIQHRVHRAYQSFFLWSAVEIWQMVIYRFNGNDIVYGLKTTIRNEPQRYFHYTRSRSGEEKIEEINFIVGPPGSTGDNLSRAKTVSASLVNSAATYLKDSAKVPLPPETQPLHDVCKYIITNYY